ncbi:hypothetical protein C8Q74DRAFT_1370657 [Fomes fomentarius]|nr:hypothetical protein C8Q74DRAFT_1370657 [Fomes fomentarius]
MLSPLLQRVLPRVFTPGALVAPALRPSLLARQHLIARTFLTTAKVAQPAAKAKAKPKASKTTKRKPAAKKAVAGKKTQVKSKAKPKAKAKAKASTKEVKDDPDARFKKGLLAVKISVSERPPMRPLSPYGSFLQEQFKGEGPLNGRDAFAAKSKELAARWRTLSDAEKKMYTDKAAEASEKYKQDRETWFAETDPRLLRALNAQRRAKNKQRIHRPAAADADKKPLTGYMQYVQEVRDSVELAPSLAPREAILERSRKIGEMWRALPAEERERYNQQYSTALAEWNDSRATKA